MRKTTGISLILLIFLSLCLITFSLLSLSGAVADEKLSQKAADRTTEYYAAVSAANAVLSDIDNILMDAEPVQTLDSTDAADLLTLICDQISADSHPALAGPVQYEGQIVSFDITVTEDQILHAALMLYLPDAVQNEDTVQDSHTRAAAKHGSKPGENTVRYDIIEWNIINTGEWHADRTQNLLRTEDLPVFSK